MRAVVYEGPRKVSVNEVPDARIEDPTDILVRVTATNICGSDLHMYEGRTDLPTGTVIGHENLGEVIEVGPGVARIEVGDRVCLPFNVCCGYCRNCNRGRTAFCLTMNPPSAGAAYGYADMGPYAGGQAELLRVPFGDVNALRLPDDSVEKESDYVMLADIFPTGWHGTRLAGLQPGDSVTVYGAGPVGIMAAYSAEIQGASQIFVVDHNADRLALAEKFGAVGIDSTKGDPADLIKEQTRGRGTDRGVEAVGWQAHDAEGNEKPAMTLNALVDIVRPTGGIGVVGVFPPQDPESSDDLMKEGKIAFDYGTFFFKGQSMGTGQANVKAYNRQLRDLIHHGRATPSRLVSHEIGLADAPDAYAHFDAREKGWTKIVLHPTQG